MKKISLLLCIQCLFAATLYAQSADEKMVRQLLDKQQETWNAGNIDAFMETYLKDDSLMFIGAKGVIYGWKNTRDRYYKSYPDKATMGQTKFGIIRYQLLAPGISMVTSTWHLTREKGDIGGLFTLVLKKVKGQWYIISDHTSSAEK